MAYYSEHTKQPHRKNEHNQQRSDQGPTALQAQVHPANSESSSSNIVMMISDQIHDMSNASEASVCTSKDITGWYISPTAFSASNSFIALLKFITPSSSFLDLGASNHTTFVEKI